MLTKIPVGGVAWLVGPVRGGLRAPRLRGLLRRGPRPDAVDVHAHERRRRRPAGRARTSPAIAERFGLEDRWAFQALHEGGRCYGMSAEQLDRLYRDAALIINMHGGTLPLPEHAATDRLDLPRHRPGRGRARGPPRRPRARSSSSSSTSPTSPGASTTATPTARCPGRARSRSSPARRRWCSTSGTTTSCPTARRSRRSATGARTYREVRVRGPSLPLEQARASSSRSSTCRCARTAPIELALAQLRATTTSLLLAEHGWRVRPGLESRRTSTRTATTSCARAGELSVAKEQNVHFRSGWFSERSATYLAAGRPVILQDTGFGNALPTGEGLFAFRDLGRARPRRSTRSQADPARHRSAAREIAREYLQLRRGARRHARPRRACKAPERAGAAEELAGSRRSCRAISRLEPRLETAAGARRGDRRARARAGRCPAVPAPTASRRASSVVMPVLDNLACTRLASRACSRTPTSIRLRGRRRRQRLGGADARVPRGARGPQPPRARRSQRAQPRLRRRLQPGARGGHAATSWCCSTTTRSCPRAGLTGAGGDTSRTRTVGLVGPDHEPLRRARPRSTRRYSTYGEMLDFAQRAPRARWRARRRSTSRSPRCSASRMRRDVFEAVGPLDERFEIGMFEDDDYARRVRGAGYRVVCAEDVFVHHFGEASLGKLAADGPLRRAVPRQPRRFEEKWGVDLGAARPPPRPRVRARSPAGSGGGAAARARGGDRARRQPGRRRARGSRRARGLAFPAARRRHVRRPPPGRRRGGDRRARAPARARRRLPGAAGDVALVARHVPELRRHLDRYRAPARTPRPRSSTG